MSQRECSRKAQQNEQFVRDEGLPPICGVALYLAESGTSGRTDDPFLATDMVANPARGATRENWPISRCTAGVRHGGNDGSQNAEPGIGKRWQTPDGALVWVRKHLPRARPASSIPFANTFRSPGTLLY